MEQYKNLLQELLLYGEVESQRAKLADGSELYTTVLYSQNIHFDLQDGFPLVSVKRTPFKFIREELKWFIRGENNVKSLQEKGVHIWDEWADKDGNLGGSYPGAWRNFGHHCPGDLPGFDQIGHLERLFRLHAKEGPNDPTIRRFKRNMLLVGFDPAVTDNRGPKGCHTLAQWHITMKGELHCDMYMRSVDCFLGLPFNIACYALLTELFARIGGLTTGKLVITMGNCHFYNNHVEGIKEILRREPKPMGTLRVVFGGKEDDRSVADWEAKVDGYTYH